MSLWITNDALNQERLNRGAIIGRFRLPLYDVNDASTITLAALPVDGSALSNTAGTLYTVPASGVTVSVVVAMTLHNSDTNARAVSLYLIPSGGSVGVASQIWADVLMPKETVTIRIPYALDPGDTIRGLAAAAGVVAFSADLLHFAAQPAGLTIKVIDGVVLGTGTATYYTVPGSGVTHAVLLGATVCNSDTAARTPTIYRSASGAGSGVAQVILGDVLGPRETIATDVPLVLEPGDFLSGKASAGAVVAARFTVLEALTQP